MTDTTTEPRTSSDREIAEWEAAHPVGAFVRYYRGDLEGPSSIGRVGNVWRLGHGTPVVSITGTTGGIALTHVEDIPQPGCVTDEYFDATERAALPAEYHRPFFVDTMTPKGWICEVCWDEGSTSAWPCSPATAGGPALANFLKLDYTS